MALVPARVFAIANQKGGVAKTTTVHSLGAALVGFGQRTLLVDLDPQACLTFSNGINPDELDVSLHDVFLGRKQAHEVLVKTQSGTHLLPACIDLAGAELHLLTKTGREFALRRALKPLRDEYDVILLDCPPSLGILTINGLTAADEVLIPLQCETLSRRGVGQLLETIDDVRDFTNPDLAIGGVIATMFDARTNHSRNVLLSVQQEHSIQVLHPPVRKSIRFAEAPEQGKTIFDLDPRSKGADAYRRLARHLAGLPSLDEAEPASAPDGTDEERTDIGDRDPAEALQLASGLSAR
ncbi:MAG TPA: AAA family ATPase [Acidimicrobiia bacterium]